jgi:hypothetical protein
VSFAAALVQTLLSNPVLAASIYQGVREMLRGKTPRLSLGLPRLFGGAPTVTGGRAPLAGPGWSITDYGGKQTVGPHGIYGHGGGPVPFFEMPGPGGGRVDIPALAAAAAAGDPFAERAIAAQAESAARMAEIDRLLEQMEQQARG